MSEKWPARVMAVFTVLIFIATAIYCVVSYLQWQVMLKALDANERDLLPENATTGWARIVA